MSLFEGLDVIKIKLYYTVKKEDNITRLVILSDEKAEEMLENEETKDSVEVLNTTWKTMNWKDNNEIMKAATNSNNPITGVTEFSLVAHRDITIKRCLQGWDLTEDGQNVPVTPQNIDRLPVNIIRSIYNKYDEIINYTEEEMGK